VNSFERIIDIIVGSDVQNSFFIRDALLSPFGYAKPRLPHPKPYEGKSVESGLSGFELQRDIIRQIRQKISKLEGQG
jgi:hypothetical protein